MGMDSKSSTIVYRTSPILCVLATLGLGIQSLRKYLLDENTTQVNHVKFNHDDPGNLYPSITLCVANPFIENELRRYEKDFNIQKYFEFLRGKMWDERMTFIDYNKVTVSLTDSLIGVKMWLENRSAYQYDHINGKQSPVGWIPHFYVKEKLAAKKCFSFDIPFINKSPVFKFQIYFKKSLFPQEYQTRASRFDPNSSTFSLQLHYPGQRIFSKLTLNKWSSKTKQPKPYNTAIGVSNVIVMVYRSRKKGQCINDWLNYDQIITDEQVVKAGCQHRHWVTEKQLPICNSHADMKEFDKQIENLKWKTRPPCKVIRSMEVGHTDYEYSKKSEAKDDFLGLSGSYKSFTTLIICKLNKHRH